MLLAVALFPLFRPPLDGFMDDCILALAYVVMALGLNLVVGFAGLLDLGYVAFYALGAMAVGWWASDFYTGVGGDEGIHIGVSGFAATLPGIHVNFLLILIGAILVCAVAGAIIGLPTLRLRGDYIAIVTLAFGEIIGRIFQNGDEITIIGDYKLSNGRQSISPIDPIDLPFLDPFDSALNLRPYYWTAFAMVLVVLFVNIRLRDSKLGPRLDRAARGRGGGGQHGRAAREDEAARLRDRRRLRRHRGRLPRHLLLEREREPVPVRLLDLHPRHGHPRRAREHLGRGASVRSRCRS